MKKLNGYEKFDGQELKPGVWYQLGKQLVLDLTGKYDCTFIDVKINGSKVLHERVAVQGELTVEGVSANSAIWVHRSPVVSAYAVATMEVEDPRVEVDPVAQLFEQFARHLGLGKSQDGQIVDEEDWDDDDLPLDLDPEDPEDVDALREVIVDEIDSDAAEDAEEVEEPSEEEPPEQPAEGS